MVEQKGRGIEDIGSQTCIDNILEDVVDRNIEKMTKASDVVDPW